MPRCAVAALVALPLSLWFSPALGETCGGALDRAQVVACALAASLDVRAARQELRILAGRRVAAGLWLPANPVVSFSMAGRFPPARNVGPSLNWLASASQEIEIAGQRWTRLDVVDAEAQAQLRRVAVVERETTALALRTYHELLAASAMLALATELGQIAETIGLLAEERAREALVAPVDASVARAEGVRLGLLRFEAERRLAVARSLLAMLLAREPAEPIVVDGTLDVPASSTALAELLARAVNLRGEITAATLERTVLERQVSMFRRARAPNLTLSLFAQRDGFDEQVFGGGISVPLPLPAPVGHTLAGEVAATRARAELASITVEQVRLRVRREVADAFAAEQSWSAALALYPPPVIERARAHLSAIREAIDSRQMSLREALLAQRSLVELLVSHLEARLAHAQAAIELARASGSSFPGVSP